MSYHQIDEVGLLAELGRLRSEHNETPGLQAEVERLRGEREEAVKILGQCQIELTESEYDLQLHKEALEKAKVALVALQGDAIDPRHRELLKQLSDSGHDNARVGLMCLDALATINDVLAK